MNGRQIILTGPDAASPSEALAWGKAAGVQEGMAMQRERLREQVEAMRNQKGWIDVNTNCRDWAFGQVLALLGKPEEHAVSPTEESARHREVLAAVIDRLMDAEQLPAVTDCLEMLREELALLVEPGEERT